MKIKEITDYLDRRLLPVYQESYDNSGFLVGDKEQEVSNVLVTLDVTPAVVDEAIARGCNLIVSHHPMIYSGMKRITPANQTGRMVIRLLQNHMAVYAAHTNLDNLDFGVSGALAQQLGLADCRVLRPVEGVLRKLVTYVPLEQAPAVRQALFEAGAGCIGAYDGCSWNSDGTGTFRASEGAHPFCGQIGEHHHEAETRIEVVYEQRIEQKLIAALIKAHPYEEPAYDLIALGNRYARVGAGMVGVLPHPMEVGDFFAMVKQRLRLPVVRASRSTLPDAGTFARSRIQTVALCGGSGSFLIGDAKAAGADIYLTGDLKYHDFQAAEDDIILADVGHFESEQFAKDVLFNIISEKFTNFACRKSEKDIGYVYYI